MTRKFKKGEIWLANLNPNRGVEPGKTRPVLIVQDQSLLEALHPSTIIIPLTTHLAEDAYPLRVRIHSQNQLLKNSDLLIDQVRAIDNKRLTTGPLTTLSVMQLGMVYRAVYEIMGMIL